MPLELVLQQMLAWAVGFSVVAIGYLLTILLLSVWLRRRVKS
ncbi:MAG: hypothetical protein QGG36_24310 [Pirellulaceae bacterium]|jgi:hypothetical protein|nr:hypothetical protein [Pirellulaceae bacterium]